MRDILLLGFTGLCLVAALRYPFAGLLTWAWFTLLTPHQEAYGLYGVPLNVVIAVPKKRATDPTTTNARSMRIPAIETELILSDLMKIASVA